MARQLEPMSDRAADLILAAVGIVLFSIVLAICSAMPNPEPALPHCPAARANVETTVRCQP